jgi:preprotein translocase subunit SecA
MDGEIAQSITTGEILLPPIAYPKVAPKAPCPCGSGKKYKYCHGNKVKRHRHKIPHT